MFGGRNFRESQFNLAAQAERQPGSAFKPIVLATAMSEGISPLTELESKPVVDRRGRPDLEGHELRPHLPRPGRAWRARWCRPTTRCTRSSRTSSGRRRSSRPRTASASAARSTPYFSIGLGSVAVNPLEMARAYATLANGGRRVDGSLFGDRPRVVERVERVRASSVEENAPSPTQVLDEGQAELLTRHPRRTSSSRGTGHARGDPGTARSPGKTGTTDNYGDAWFVGYTPELVVAVWVGYPDALRPMLTEFGGEPVAGGTLPGADLEGVRREASTEDETASFDVRAVPRRRLDLGRAARRRVAARQRLLPRRAARRLLLRQRARHGRPTASRTRSRSRSSSG